MTLTDPNIPSTFVDDGCSNSPDAICGISIREACRIHDWRYCTRGHTHGTMCKEHRRAADKELRANIAKALPWWNQWVRWIYWRAVRRFGSIHAYDTCGVSAGDYCRHNMPMPVWMRIIQVTDAWQRTLEDV